MKKRKQKIHSYEIKNLTTTLDKLCPKIWRGERYHASGEKQIMEYLDYFGLNTGYMLSFNFNQNKITGVRRVEIEDKVLYEGTV